jgi:hypothetical protein
MISDGCSYANRNVLVQCVGEHLLPTTQTRNLSRRPPVAAPRTGNRHVDPCGHLIPGQALVAQLKDLLCGGGMSGRTARPHHDAGTLELLTNRAQMNAQLGTDQAQCPALGIQLPSNVRHHTSIQLTSVQLGHKGHHNPGAAHRRGLAVLRRRGSATN